jgi:hypothetical protein
LLVLEFEDGYECQLRREASYDMLSAKVSKHEKNVWLMTIPEYKIL